MCVSIVGCAIVAGCGGNGEGLDQNGRPPTATASAGNTISPSFSSIQDNVFTPICTACHSGATAPQGLRLDAANSYTLLVSVDSAEVPSVKRVAPGNPDSSYLIQKLRGTAAVGARMPLGGPYLSDTTIAAIAQWIQNGAPRQSASAPGEGLLTADVSGLRIVTAAPAEGDIVGTALGQLVVGFDRELDVNLVNPSTVALERLDTHTTIPARLSVPISVPSTLLINPTKPLADGSYRLLLRGTGGGALAGLNAVPLNSAGDFSGGRDSTIEFSIKVQQ